MDGNKIVGWWLAGLAATSLSLAASFSFLDAAIANYFLGRMSHISRLGILFSTSVLMVFALSLIALIAALRIVRGHLPESIRIFFFALCVAVICFAGNDYVLKPFFGRPTPFDVFALHSDWGFHFFKGDSHSGFPSGHMMMASSFTAIFGSVNGKVMLALITLIVILVPLLLMGQWHFLSDIIAGIFIGTTVGLLASELWRRHIQRESEV
jgi:membrane-associated phospholipid phosphatase